jgi:hypothetical protein
MEPLDLYLKTVGMYLPKGQRDDIVRELSDHLLSQREERESELGRPLTAAEQEALLEQHGPPRLVAGRYQTSRRTFTFGRLLIGPVLFPLYTKILALNAGLTLLVSAAAALLFAGRQPFLQTASAIFVHLSIQFAIVTLIFTLAEAQSAKFPDLWNTRSPLLLKPRQDKSRVPRAESIAEILALTVFLLWWLAVPGSLSAMLGGGAAALKTGPGWQIFYGPVLLLTLAGLAAAGITLARPRWVRFRLTARLVITGLFLAVLGVSLKAGSWLILTEAGAGAARHRQGIETLNRWIALALIFTAAGCAVRMLLDLRRLTRRGAAAIPAAPSAG